MSISVFNDRDFEVIAREYAKLRESARKRCATPEEFELCNKAFEFANEAHKNVRRRSGEPYILHPIEVAKIVVDDIGLGCKSICAALLHDVVEDTDYKVEDIERLFGSKVASLVEGLTKIKTVLDNQDKNTPEEAYTASLQAENFKRILLTLNDDVRVVLIKLADRLHNCRTIEFMPEYKRDKILSETMFIFIPLAHRLGLYGVKSEMENIWLRYKEPDAYNSITANVNRNLSEKTNEIEDFAKPISAALKAAGFDFEIRKRVKTPYSIWHKMNTKNVTFEQVYDLYAIRIIFNPDKASNKSERDQCYHIFSIVTDIYRYKPDRVRDWVKTPKSNGYEALHCTLLSNKGVWVEVQIRTKRMDDIAEKGIAAHWAYKHDGSEISVAANEMDKWLGKVKEIIVNPDVNALELLDIIHHDLVVSDISVFTPKGEQKSVPKGATALDFAYLIHSQIGTMAIAAKVNMRLVPLSYQLKTGDQVEIITAEDSRPKKEWLRFLQTRHARTLVLDYFKENRKAFVEEGRTMLTDRLGTIGASLDTQTLRNIISAFDDINNEEELYFRFALEQISLEQISKVLESHETQMIRATCCNPIAGDPVIAFKDLQGNITIHLKTCPVAERLAAQHGDWIVKVPEWEENTYINFSARIMLRGVDRVGLLNEITKVISLNMTINITRLSLKGEQGIMEGVLDLEVPGKGTLESLIAQLRKIEGIQSVIRIDN